MNFKNFQVFFPKSFLRPSNFLLETSPKKSDRWRTVAKSVRFKRVKFVKLSIK